MKHFRFFISLAVLWALFAAIVVGSHSAPAAAGAGTSVLKVGEVLNEGQALVSANGLYTAALQGDGNFVVYGPNGPMWADHVNNYFGPNHLAFQGDGNLVAYLWNNYPLWATGTDRTGAQFMVMQDDGNLVIYTAGDRAVWATGTGRVSSVAPPAPVPAPAPSAPPSPVFPTSTLVTGQWLQEGQTLSSPNGAYRAVLQGDGNFVVYDAGSNPLWANGLNNHFGANSLVLQGDGNLVAYLWNGYPLWATGTSASGQAMLVMQDDGNLVLYAAGRALWASNTGAAARTFCGPDGGCDATMTPDGTPFVLSDPAASSALVSATPSTGGNNREFFWNQASSVTADESACATFQTGGSYNQQGIALRINSNDGATTGVTVTRNVIYGVFSVFNFHFWNSANRVTPLVMFGQSDLTNYLGTTAAVYPLNMCARTVGTQVQFIIWRPGETQPAWGTTSQGGSATLPAGVGATGKAGFYVAHISPGASTLFTNLTVNGSPSGPVGS